MKAEVINANTSGMPSQLLWKTPYIKEELKSIGIDVTYYPYVDDTTLEQKFLNAWQRNNIVIISAATQTKTDYEVKQMLQKVLGMPLYKDINTMEQLENAFNRNRLDVPETVSSLTMFPQNSNIYPNERGLQNGFSIEIGGQVIIYIPDDIVQATDMYNNYVFPYLSKFTGNFSQYRSVGIYGLTSDYVNSQIEKKIHDKNSVVSVNNREDDITVRVATVAESEESATVKSFVTIKSIVDIFHDYVYGVDIKDNEQALMNELIHQDMIASYVDMYTDGVLAQRLYKCSEYKKIFSSYVSTNLSQKNVIDEGVSPAFIQKHALVSENTAVALAYNSLTFNNTDIAVAIIGDKVSGNTDGKIYIAVCDRTQVYIECLDIPNYFNTYQIQAITASKAINITRLFVKDYPNSLETKNIDSFIEITQEQKEINKNINNELREKTPQKINRNLQIENLYIKADDKPQNEHKVIGENGKNTEVKKEKNCKNNKKAKTPKKKGSSMKNFLKFVLFSLAICMFIGSVSYIIYHFLSSDSAKKHYEEVADLAIQANDMVKKEEIPTDYPEQYQPRFLELWKINKDIAGWVRIGKEDNPVINYPVVQRKGDKNAYYNRKDFNQDYSRYGVPFVDYESDLSMPSDNIIIYGHNMKDGQMFGAFENYRTLGFFKKNPVVNFDSIYSDGEYIIFGVFFASTLPQDNPFNYHWFTQADNDEEFNTFVSEVKKRSIFNIPVDVNPNDDLLTLSTCIYKFNNDKKYDGGRFVIVGRKIRDGEDVSKYVSYAKVNPKPLMPDPYYREDKPDIIKPTSIAIVQSDMVMKVGKSTQLTYKVEPEGAVALGVNWSSSNQSAVKVQAGGLIEAVGEGTSVITVQDEQGNLKNSITVTVEGVKEEEKLEKIYFDDDKIDIAVGDTKRAYLELRPRGIKDVKIYWESDNTNVATVNQRGQIEARRVGDAVIKAMTYDEKMYAEITVNVIDKVVRVRDISIISSDTSIVKGEQKTLKAQITPFNATDSDYTWLSENEDIVTVNSKTGRITGVKEGRAKIIVKTLDARRQDYIYITVEKPKGVLVTGIDVSDKLDMIVGSTKVLSPKISPLNATNKNIYYTSSDTAIISVNEKGVLKANKSGTAIVTVTTEDGGFKATCIVTVKDANVPVISVEFVKKDVQIEAGSEENLRIKITPDNATDKKASFNSSNQEVATVDQNGKVRAIKEGNATINVLCGKQTATCNVIVVPKKPVNINVKGININVSNLNINKGETKTLRATVSPLEATNKNIIYSSQDNDIASVNQSGVVTANDIGVTTITAKSEDGGFEKDCSVTVTEVKPQDIAVTGISLSKNDIELTQGDTKSLSKTIEPSDATNKDVMWVSDDDNVATVSSSGKVIAIGEGETQITVTSKDGDFTDTCNVKVNPKIEEIKVSDVSLDKVDLSIKVGENSSLKATVNPQDAINKDVSWKSDNESIATVSSSGKITGIKEGTAIIIVTTKDGDFSAQCTVTVEAEEIVE